MQNVTDFCVGRFEHLTKYYKDITMDDLKYLNETDLLAPINNRNHKLLAKILIRSHLLKNNEDICLDEHVVKPQEINDIYTYQSEKKLKIHNVSVFHKCDDIKLNEALRECEYIDLSEQFITDEYFSHIVDIIIEKCAHVKIINLCRNRLKYADDLILKLVKQPSIEYIDISINPIASIERKEFWTCLDLEILSKLIWIPWNWVQTGSWKTFWSDQDSVHITITRKTHEIYYNTCSQ